MWTYALREHTQVNLRFERFDIQLFRFDFPLSVNVFHETVSMAKQLRSRPMIARIEQSNKLAETVAAHFDFIESGHPLIEDKSEPCFSCIVMVGRGY